MPKIQRNYRLDQQLFDRMTELLKRHPKVTYTDVVETALGLFLFLPLPDVDRLLGEYLLRGTVIPAPCRKKPTSKSPK